MIVRIYTFAGVCLFSLGFIAEVGAITYYQIGNSLTFDSLPANGAFTEVANNNGQSITDNGWHVSAGRRLNYIFSNPDDPENLLGPSGNWQTVLTNYPVDIVTFQPFYNGTSTLGSDTTAIVSWINLATGNASPDAVFYIYAAWPEISISKSYSEQWLEGVTNSDTQPTRLSRAYIATLVNRVTSNVGNPVQVVPIGEVWFRVEELIDLGVITELNSAYDLYRDDAHANDIGRSLIAWTMYASFFQESAIGVALPDIYAFFNNAPVKIDAVLALKLQRAVNDVVFGPGPDSNNDGIPDVTAIQLGLDPYNVNGDSDQDGKPDVIEIGRDVNNPLDTDVDGVIDALEPDPADIDPATAGGLGLMNGDRLTIVTGAGEMLSNVVVSNSPDSSVAADFPFGLISYTTTSPVGGSVVVTLRLSVDLPQITVVYKIDANGNYTELPSDRWERAGQKSIKITLTDADPLTDLDGLANGSIDDPIAIGSGTASAANGSSGGGGGCTLGGSTRIDVLWFLYVLMSCAVLYKNRTIITVNYNAKIGS
ncbi:MAG TPA: hypothetical protein ENI62_10440 [Gammaproteobacteria bacterium]|nr:hypothetical protein [Gammaproteobacteria bacterium]